MLLKYYDFLSYRHMSIPSPAFSSNRRLKPETLFLAANYTDRFLSYMHVTRGKLQLVGVTAMFVAAKFEEIYPPTAAEFVYISDYTYTRDQVCAL